MWAQGGNLAEVCKHGLNEQVGLLINSSRGIIYASRELDFAEKAREEAQVTTRNGSYFKTTFSFRIKLLKQ